MTPEEAKAMGFELITLDVGDHVYCDSCNGDWTNRPESGGIYGLMTKAFCPDCAPRIEAQAAADGESQYIRARCPEGMSFADWVRNELR